MAKTLKRLLSLVVAVVMVISMVPAVYAAETETEQTTPTRGAALGASKTYEAEGWTEVSTVAELKAALGNGTGVNAKEDQTTVKGVRLTDDITITKELDGNKTSGTMLYVGYYGSSTTYATNHVVLDLNGHTLTTDETVQRSRLFGVYGDNSSFVITNGSIVMDGTFTGYASFCFFHVVNALTLDGVSLTNKDETERVSYGGLLHTSKSGSSFTFINSDIVKESGAVSRGGILNTGNDSITITATNSTFTGGKVTGGVYSNTTYLARGGQFYVASGSTLTATNCSFTGGVSESSDLTTYVSEGGNIYGYGTAKLTLTDCDVSGGTANCGGNIGILGATLKLNNTTVSGGQVIAKGGNIYAESTSTYKSTSVTLSGSTVKDGRAVNTADALVYGGNIYLTGGEDKAACKLYVNDGSIVSGGYVDSPTTTASTYIGGGNIYGVGGVTVTINEGTVSGGKVYSGASTVALTAGGNIYVATSSLTLNSGATVSGGTVDSAVTNAARGGNIAYSGSTLNLYDGATVSGGEAHRGGNLFSPTTSSKMYLYGGVVKNGTASEYGANMYFNGQCRIYDGTTISGGTCKSSIGKALYVASHASAKCYIYGGNILSTGSSAVYKGTNGTLDIYSGVFATNPKEAYIADCSTRPTEKEADGYYHVYHNDVEGSTTVVDATCTADGTKTIECATCSGTYTYTIAATGHSYDAVVTAPTCTANGYTTYTCSACGDSYTDDVVAATGHSYNAVKTEPTCDVAGYITYTCSACGDSYQEEIAATGHTAVVDAAVAPGCETTGLTAGSHCSVCGETITAQEVVPATGHAWNEGVIDPKPTCNSAGTKTYTCANCGETKTEAVSATGHTEVIDAAVAATCSTTGLTQGSHCSVCDEVIVAQEIVPTVAHTEVTDAAVAATCTATGLTEGKHCSVCGEVIVAQTEIPALGHTEVTLAAKAPTCTETGLTEGSYCSVCGETIVAQEEVAATGHSYEGVYTEPTYEADAYTTYTCSSCGASYVETHEGTKLERVAVAQIGEDTYTSLEDAAAAAQAGQTITLLGDVTLSAELTLPAGITLNGNGWAIDGTVVAGGDLTIAGHTKVTSFNAGFYNRTITIGEGACLEVTGSGRVTVGWGNTFNITGSIEDAKTADKANVKPSLIIPGGISITGSGANFNVTNAYIKVGNTSSKNSAATDEFNLSFENSIVEWTHQFTLSTPTGGKTPTFNVTVKDSVMTTATKLCIAAADSNVVIDNSTVTLGTYLRNSGELTLQNGAELTGSMIQYGESGGNDGTITVDASTLTIKNNNSAYAMDGKGTGVLQVVNGGTAAVDYITESAVTVDTESSLTAKQIMDSCTIEVDAANFSGEGSVQVLNLTTALTEEQLAAVSVVNNDKAAVEITATGVQVIRDPNAPAEVTTAAELKAALEAGGQIVMLADITFENTEYPTVREDTVLDLNGHTFTLAKTWFDVTATLTVKDSAGNGQIVTKSLNDPSCYGSIDLCGGTFVLESGTVDFVNLYNDYSTVTVNGGTLSAVGVNEYIEGVENISFNVDPSAMLPSEYEAVDNGDSTWGIQKAKRVFIGETGYLTLEEALNAAQAGDTIEIVKAGEYELKCSNYSEGRYYLPANLTITGVDGVVVTNGPAISADSLTIDNVDFVYPYDRGLVFYLSGDSAIKNSHIEGRNGTYYSCASGTLAIENCEIIGTSSYGLHIAEGNAVVTVTDSTIGGWNTYGSNITTTFNGCTFVDDYDYAHLGFYTDVTLNDCVFEPDMFVFAQTDSVTMELNDCSVSDGSDLLSVLDADMIAENMVYVDGELLGGKILIGTTKYDTLAEAVEAAAEGDTIKLLADITLTERVTVSKAITLDLGGFDITGNVADSYGMIYVGVAGNLTVVSNAAAVTFSLEGSEITNEGGYAIGNYGTVSVDNVTLTGTDTALYNFYYNETTYGKATIGENASVSSVWNCGELTVEGNADYIDNSGALTVTGTAAEIYAQDGSDAAGVAGAGTITIADTANVSVPEGYKLQETETAGTYQVVEKTYVAQIGDTKYETFEKAVANIATDGSDTTIKLLTDIEVGQDIAFNYGDGKIIFTADEPVTVKQTALGTDFDFTQASDAVIVIDKNVTFEVYDNSSGIYLYYGPSMEISGTVTGGQNWGALYLFQGEHTVTETGTVSVGRVQIGYTTLTVLGTIDSNYLLVEGSELIANGATIDVGTIHDSNNGSARWGESTMDFLNGTNVTANSVNLAYADSVITLDLTSSITAGSIKGIGKIVIDAAAFDGTETTVINADMSGFTGEVEVINAEKATYEITDGALKVVKVKIKPDATVTVLGSQTLTDYDVWDGSKLTAGTEELPLEIVMNFKANETLEECLDNGYSQWLTDFNITFTGLENGSITADNCYLAGNYGTYGWIVIPTNGLVLEEGVTYPVVAAYDPTLNYKDICKSVKDFTAAIHIDPAILEANPNLQVKLELVMTNPEDATDKMVMGEPAIYTAEQLKSGICAQNVQTGEFYSSVATALTEAQPGETVKLLADTTETARYVIIGEGVALDLNGYTLTVQNRLIAVTTTSYIIDSTNGTGLLKIDPSKLSISDNAADGTASLPVWIEEVAGYRVAKLKVSRGFLAQDEDKAQLFFYFGNTEAALIASELADGKGDNDGLKMAVRVYYTNAKGTEQDADIVINDANMITYGEKWNTHSVQVTVSGLSDLTNVTFEIVVTSGDVEYISRPLTYTGG